MWSSAKGAALLGLLLAQSAGDSSAVMHSLQRIPEPVWAQRWRLVRVLDREENGFRPLGTGFILVRQRTAFVVTNEHIVRKAKGTPWVGVGKQAHESVSRATDAAYDLAVLKLGTDVEISGETSESASGVAAGQTLYAFGFPDDLAGGSEPLASVGRVVWAGPYVPEKQLLITSGVYPGATIPAFVVAGIACRQGASGGPIFDPAGAIVGYVKGTIQSGECLGISIERALELMR